MKKAFYLLFLITCPYFMHAQEFKLNKETNKWALVGVKSPGDTNMSFDEIQPCELGFCPVANDGKWGILRGDGMLLVPLKYDDIQIMSRKYWKVQLDGKWGVISSAGEEILTPQFEGVDSYTSAGATIKKDGLWYTMKDGVLSQEDVVFRDMEIKPVLLGCGTVPASEQEDCSNRKLITSVFKNLKYPALARENGIQGIVVASLRINSDGETVGAAIRKPLNPACDQEVLRVLNSINLRWIPGMVEGQPVNCELFLPIRFKLE